MGEERRRRCAPGDVLLPCLEPDARPNFDPTDPVSEKRTWSRTTTRTSARRTEGGEAAAARSVAPRAGAERLSGGAAERRFRVKRRFRRSEGGEGLRF